jgi:NAD(P)-dependent dehydrogenase (short-subunit alcohol dehydrogenase family)
MQRLKGKTALVSGAASGIGRASAMLFAAEGANLVVLDRSPAVEETAAAIKKDGGRVVALVRDSSVEANVAEAVDTAVKEFGMLDVCFANAGVSGGLVPLQEQTPEQWSEILKINLIGTFLAVKHAARVMAPKGSGSIICTASVAGLRNGAGGSPYSASKAGVISLVQTSAYQLGGTGIRINAICPGLIETGMTRPIFEQARARGTDRKIGQLNPLRRACRVRIPSCLRRCDLLCLAAQLFLPAGVAVSVAADLRHTIDSHGRSAMDDYEPEYESRGFDFVQTVFLFGAIALIAAPVVKGVLRRWRVKHPVALGEPAIDKSLKDTFPASDPPASRYFDIPENRR